MLRVIKCILSLVLVLILVNGCAKQGTSRLTYSIEETKEAITSTHRKRSDNLPPIDKDLEAMIQRQLPTQNGIWAVYYKNLETGCAVSIGNQKMVSASLIKLFIMGMIYDEIEQGNLKPSEHIESLIEQMITVSHNASSNELVAIAANGDFDAGMKLVNDFAAKMGCSDTEQQRDMLDDRPVPIPQQNYTSVKDCAVLLEKIYNKECVSESADEKMLAYLLAQQRDWKIPAGLPAYVKVANKTGELSSTENDVAIVFAEKADYILCVISNELENKEQAQQSIRDLSAAVYDYVMQSLEKEK